MRGELFINGCWRRGTGRRFQSHDPGLGGAVWAGEAASLQDVAAAFAAAAGAFPGWARTPLEERIACARRFAAALETSREALANVIARETGKPLWEARTEVAAMIGKVEISIRAQAQRAGEQSEPTAFGATALRHRPHGVMAVLGPYNFPGHLPNGHIVPALLAGNTVVFKPSEFTPGVAEAMLAAWEAARLPGGVLNLVHGGRETGAAVLEDAALAGVLFTGSAPTGLMIHRRFAGRPDVILALEMGGNNPLIAWEPAEPEAAANLIVHSAFLTTGQRCSCARRLILPAGAFGDAVLAQLSALAQGLRSAPWNAEPAPFMGPLVREATAANAEAAARALDGRALTPLQREGAFLRPYVLDMTDAPDPPDEEIFAPVLQVYRVRDFEAALARANATRFGLAGGLISADAALWARAQQEMRAGVLNWNRPTTGAASALPFGGPGLSGNGRPSAFYAADYCAWPMAMQLAPQVAPIAAPGLG